MNAPDLLPPHSIEAEQSVIGGLLLDNRAWDRIAGQVAEADFYRDEHRRIFRHITRMLDRGQPADVVTAIPVFDGDPKREQARLVQIIGARMREARELCNMSQSAAAKRLGYSNPSKLSKVEGATDTNSAPLWLISRASKLYDVSVDFLFGLTDDFEVGLQRGVQTWLVVELEKSRIRDMTELEKLHRRVTAISSLLPTVADEAERTAEAIKRFAELNPEFDDMRGGARLAAAAENLVRHAAKANSTAQRFRIEIGVDRSNQPTTPEGEPA